MASKGDINKVDIQPPLNENWWVLNFENTIKKAGKFTKLKSKDYFEEGEYPVVDQGDQIISGYVNNREFLYKGNVPVIIFGDHTRNLKYIDFEFAIGADGTKILVPENTYNSRFYYYYLRSLTIPDFGYSRHYKVLRELDYPLPPRPEQDRIVAKLDKLFGQLDTINESLKKIPVLLKNFRQQVLTQALTGKLTEEWRKGKDLEEWKDLKLSDLILEKPRNGYSPQGVEYETPVKSMTLSATTSGKFDSKHVKYLDIEIPKNDSHLWLKNGNILIQRSNSFEYVGTAVIYDGKDNDFIYPDLMMKIKANEKILNTYLIYSLNSSVTRKYFQSNASGTAGNMPKINQTTVMNTPIPYPPSIEQEEIVSRVQSLFRQVNLVEQQYLSLKQKVKNLPQSILNKAFKGELMPQLESDGDARELLREVKNISGDLVKKASDRRKKMAEFNENFRGYVDNEEDLSAAAESDSNYKENI